MGEEIPLAPSRRLSQRHFGPDPRYQPFGVIRMNPLSCRPAWSYRSSAEATAMILSGVFERFSRDSPLSVMAQGLMVNALGPRIVDQLFEDVAEKPYTNTLLSSTIVDLMS